MSSINRWLAALLLPVLMAATLAGCDIAADVRLGGTPLNSGGEGDNVDPGNEDNVTAYFYAGRPVEGLLYNCKLLDTTSVTGYTDENGRFVCPRTSVVSFFLGVAGVATVKLGEMNLIVFGTVSDGEARNNVVITPASLDRPASNSTYYPIGVTATDGDVPQVANLFNLLVSLDTAIDRNGRYQETIALTPEMHAALVEADSFSDIDLKLDPAVFANGLQVLIGELDAMTDSGAVLVNHTALSAAEAKALANRSILRARAGLYRTNSLIYATADNDNSGMILVSTLVVGNEGVATGFTQAMTVEASNNEAEPLRVLNLDLYILDAAARVQADGLLSAFLFELDGGGETISITGSLINDAIWGGDRICNNESLNSRIPVPYCNGSVSNDGYNSAQDAGLLLAPADLPVFEADLFMSRVAESLPDIDLDLLPPEYLPRTFELTLGKYTDVQQAEFQDPALKLFSAVKTAFGTPVQEDPALPVLRYSVLPNGDIISDSDADCAAVTLVDGIYQDSTGATREYLLGRVGNVLEVDDEDAGSTATEDFLTLQFSVTDPDHPHYGLMVGYPALFRDSLYPMVLRVSDGKLIPKLECSYTGECTSYRIEWFNDIRFHRDVAVADLANRGTSDEEAADDLIYKNGVYYGQVISNVQTTDIGPLCPVTAP